MISPLVMLAAATLHCTAVVDNGGPVVRHNLSFLANGQMTDTMLTGLGAVRTRYAITESDRSGFNATAALAPDATGVMIVDYATGRFMQLVRVNQVVRSAVGVCRR